MIKIRRTTAISHAIGEQLKSQVAEDGLENRRRGTIATPQQIVGYRRRPENILTGMIKDEWFSKEELNQQSQLKQIIKKKNHREHKRGTRSIQSIVKRMCRNKKKPLTIG